MRLYKAMDVADYADVEEIDGDWMETVPAAPKTEAEGAPKGWDEHCRQVWGEPHPFFIPSDRPIYRSRSSAQHRVDLINRWGGAAILVETDTDWQPVTVANARRRNARKRAQINRLRERANRIAADMEEE
jgi:hypothetical protein